MKKSLNPRRLKTRYVAYVAASIDGRISLEKAKRPAWTSKEDWNFLQRSLARADAVVVGRNTYHAAKERLHKRRTYVLTSRVTKPKSEESVTFVNPKNTDLKKLFAEYRTVATLGAGRVYQTMLDAGLLHDLYVTIEPLVFGRGNDMFVGGTKTKRFTLVSVKKMNKSGTLLLHYHV